MVGLMIGRRIEKVMNLGWELLGIIREITDWKSKKGVAKIGNFSLYNSSYKKIILLI